MPDANAGLGDGPLSPGAYPLTFVLILITHVLLLITPVLLLITRLLLTSSASSQRLLRLTAFHTWERNLRAAIGPDISPPYNAWTPLISSPTSANPFSISEMQPLDPTRESRPFFPALESHPDFIFADSAGGSAILGSCIDKLREYYTNSNVQIGARILRRHYVFQESVRRRR